MLAELNRSFAAEVQELVPKGEAKARQQSGSSCACTATVTGCCGATTAAHHVADKWECPHCCPLCFCATGKQIIVLCESGGSLENKSGTKVRLASLRVCAGSRVASGAER